MNDKLPPKSIAVSTKASAEGALYAKHKKIYPRRTHGVFTRLRTLSVIVLLGIYYVMPWVPWGDRQAVLFDLPARKFYIFDWTFWPQDFFYMALLLIIAALSLFFFTALAGRLWCGYACPQTVWTEAYLWMERLVEGDRSERMKLDQGPWDAEKITKKTLKQTLWIAFSFLTGFTFVGYFTPVAELWNNIVTFSTGPWETFWVLFYGFATYGNAGYLREQVCTYMCPYARFQSAMFDKDTMIISYDEKRGEPRGSRKRSADPKALGLGECVDCTVCVQVCPVGIDIRDGLQYQCIGCAVCIDACNEIMDKMDYPRGLIRYTTENALQGKPAHVLRPRVVIYAGLMIVIVGALFYAIATRTPLDLDVIRDRNSLYRETNEGWVENVYTMKVINMDERPHIYRLSVTGLEGAVLSIRGDAIQVPAGEVLNLPVGVSVDPANLKSASTEVEFILEATDVPDLKVTETGRFVGPALGR